MSRTSPMTVETENKARHRAWKELQDEMREEWLSTLRANAATLKLLYPEMTPAQRGAAARIAATAEMQGKYAARLRARRALLRAELRRAAGWIDGRSEGRGAMWERPLRRRCPTCEQPVGARCVSASGGRISSPHAARR